MDYEKKYKEALERAKEQLKGARVFDYKDGQIANDIRTTTYAIFPELKESEGEIIREMCIRYLDRGYQHCSFADDRKNIEKCVTWLEKQGEQMSVWREEDGRMCNASIRACQYMVEHFENSTKDCEDAIDWLKSLKDRAKLQWKPSDEQMRALHDLNLTGKISYAGQGQKLIDLYNDLRKLKE